MFQKCVAVHEHLSATKNVGISIANVANVHCTCARIFVFSSGAVDVRETIPATPPARRALHMTIDAGGIGGGAKSEPTEMVSKTQSHKQSHAAVYTDEFA